MTNKAYIYLKSEYQKHPIEFVFFAVMIIFEVSLFVAGLLTGGEEIKKLLFYDDNVVGLDFFGCLCTSLNMGNDIYTPMTQLFFLILGTLILPTSGGIARTELATTQMGFLVYSLYIVIACLLLYVLIQKTKIGSDTNKKLCFGVFLLSLPTLYVIERGNIILLVAALVFFFIFNYDSEKKYVRYASYVALAIAVGFKLYPILLCVLLIKKIRKKDMIICLVVGVIIFFTPFILSNGTFIQQIENIINYFQSTRDIVHVDYIDFGNTIGMTASLLKINVSLAVADGISIAMWFVAAALIVINKNVQKWKIVTLALVAMTICIGFRPIYCILFMIPAVILFLNEHDDKKINWVYLALFILMFIPMIQITLGTNSVGHAFMISTVLESYSLMAMMIILICESIVALKKKHAAVCTT